MFGINFRRRAARALTSIGDLLGGRLVNQTSLRENLMGQQEIFDQKLAGLRQAVDSVNETVTREGEEIKSIGTHFAEEISSLREQVRALEGGDKVDFGGLDDLTARLTQTGERIGGLSDTLTAAAESLPAPGESGGGGDVTGGAQPGGAFGTGSGAETGGTSSGGETGGAGDTEAADTGAGASDSSAQESEPSQPTPVRDTTE